MVDCVKVEDDADIADSCAQKEIVNTAFVVNALLFFGKQQHDEHDDHR